MWFKALRALMSLAPDAIYTLTQALNLLKAMQPIDQDTVADRMFKEAEKQALMRGLDEALSRIPVRRK